MFLLNEVNTMNEYDRHAKFHWKSESSKHIPIEYRIQKTQCM